ncbi:ROK family protein [Paenibacillus taichungensis]|uniref:ROK family protein n=1 Tax=Paenibacillus taichungensis TaxID=484184 RepID=A0ABX2MUA1_9BACL|nr:MULTISPECIES: ROK family protein [Paenibacillus]NUU57660.1 ROK family protein [Paenibacillus taichungensis]PIH58576.1 transcriptional regulator [Paenibacillus sp. LK1]
MLPTSHNTQQVKRINVELVKNTLRSMGVGTKASIANLTKLSVATCGTILNELLQTGEIIDLGPDESSGGRPASRYQFNADYASVLCLIIRTEGGIHSITHTYANLNGEMADEQTLFLDEINVTVVEDLIASLIETHHNVQAIGIGIPGVAHNGVIGICDVSELAGQPLGPRLKEQYDDVEVVIGNDMNLTVYGLYNQQQFEEEKNFAVVTFPENHFPGAGFIIDGRPLTGNTQFGGEVSFLPFGVSREEQLRMLNTPDGLQKLVVQTLVSIIAIINPATIVVTGDTMDPAMRDGLTQGCLDMIPQEHMPGLIIQRDTRREYVTGLVAVTLESLTYRIQVVEKQW